MVAAERRYVNSPLRCHTISFLSFFLRLAYIILTGQAEKSKKKLYQRLRDSVCTHPSISTYILLFFVNDGWGDKRYANITAGSPPQFLYLSIIL